jgi:hypothetical protein
VDVTVVGNGLTEINSLAEFFEDIVIEAAKHEKTSRGQFGFGLGQIDPPEIAGAFKPVLSFVTQVR